MLGGEEWRRPRLLLQVEPYLPYLGSYENLRHIPKLRNSGVSGRVRIDGLGFRGLRVRSFFFKVQRTNSKGLGVRGFRGFGRRGSGFRG